MARPVFVGLSYAGSYGLVWLAIGIAAAVLLRRPGPALAVFLAVAVADLSATGIKQAVGRLYVGAHYPLDVLAGAALGAAVATALLLLSRALRRSRSRPTPVPSTGRSRDSPCRRTRPG